MRPESQPTLPSVSLLAAELRCYHLAAYDGELEVRLQALPTRWTTLHGDPQYDLCHQGYWGATVIPPRNEPYTRDDAMTDAADLIEQVLAQYQEDLSLVSTVTNRIVR